MIEPKLSIQKSLVEQEPGVFMLEDGKKTALKTSISGEKQFKIILKKDSHLDFALSLEQNALINLEFLLEGQNSSVDFLLISKAQNSEIQKSSITILHSAPNTRSSAKSKSVAFDSACVEMKTIAKVEPQAHGSKSRVECKALLLGENAKARADPILEILNNDVECLHAASIKEIEKEKIFYLQTRGMNEQEAKSLIVDGFLGLD
jgi:Fe-S cluster assembly scaffold protein SufB